MSVLLAGLLSFFFRKSTPVLSKSFSTKFGLVPSPPVLHAVVPDHVVFKKKLFIIGDVHGCFDELKELLRKSGVENNTSVVVIFVGDLINKGPKNVDVVQFVMSLGKRALAVRGNHDEESLREWIKMSEDPSYELPERYQWVKELGLDEVDFLLSLPYTLRIPAAGIGIVHAGLVPGKPIEENQPSHMITMRNLIVHDYFGYDYTPTKAITEGVPWASLWRGPEHVYFGHDARRRLQLHEFATGLDTGCVYGAELTGILLDGNEKIFFSVKSFKEYKTPRLRKQ